MPPPEGDLGWSAVHFEHLPGKCRHHPLEGLVRLREIRRGRAVVFVGGDDGVVCADLEHMLARLRWAAVDGEAVVVVVDCPPVLEVHLEGCFDLPVLDQIFHNHLKAAVIV